MKKIFFILFTIILFSNASADNGEKIIKTTKEIKYLSQKIAKDYLYLYCSPKKIEIKTSLSDDIKRLEEDFRLVARSTDNADTKNVLDFLSYSKDQIKEILEEDVSLESVVLMLDSSAAMSEGTESILSTYKYNSFNDKDIGINLMKVFKFYMLSHKDINPILGKEQLKSEIEIVDKKLKNFNVSVNQSWLAIKDLLNSKEDYFIPNILFILMKNMENITKI